MGQLFYAIVKNVFEYAKLSETCLKYIRNWSKQS